MADLSHNVVVNIDQLKDQSIINKAHEKEAVIEVPVFYQAIPQETNRNQDFWSTRFPFYRKPRIYSPDNHLDREQFNVTQNNRFETRSPKLFKSLKENESESLIAKESKEDGNFNSNIKEDFIESSYTGRNYREDIPESEENIIIVHPSDYFVNKGKDAFLFGVNNNGALNSKPEKIQDHDEYTRSEFESEIVKNGKRQYSCKYCDKGYMTLGALKMHIRTHTLPCKCHICGKAFSRQWLLQGHIRTHTGERPYACSYCTRAFADRSNLRAHMQTHIVGEGLACVHCYKVFNRAPLLLKHVEQFCEVKKLKDAAQQNNIP